MGITLQSNARNAAASAIAALVDVSGPGDLQVATTAFASILATIALANPAFGSPSSGAVPLQSTPLTDSAADNTGTAAVWRMRDGAATIVLDGPAATSGGGDINLSTAAQRAALDAVTALLDGGGDVQFATDSTFGSVLATLPLNSDSFAAATGSAPATAAMNTGTPVSAAASASGTATAFRMRTSGGTEVLRGTVGTSGADINFNSNVFASGTTVTLNSFTLSQPATSAASDGALVLGTLSITAGQAVTVTSGSYTHPAS